MDFLLEEIKEIVANIEMGKIRNLIRKALRKGIPAYQIFMDGIVPGMDLVGQKYETKEYFLTELLGAAHILKEGMAELNPYLQHNPIKRIGKVVLGTVKGDLHDIGKNVFNMLLTSAAFEVYDLGIDIPSKSFVEKVKETNADILALSALLTTTMYEMKTVIEELNKAGLRGMVKVIIGGAPINDEFAKKIGADAAGKDAAHGVRICKEWIFEGTKK